MSPSVKLRRRKKIRTCPIALEAALPNHLRQLQRLEVLRSLPLLWRTMTESEPRVATSRPRNPLTSSKPVSGQREQRQQLRLLTTIGTFVKSADQQRLKEERKIIAGYSSGRRAPELAGEDGTTDSTQPNDEERNETEEGRELVAENAVKVYVSIWRAPCCLSDPPHRSRLRQTTALSLAWSGGTKPSCRKTFVRHASDPAPSKRSTTSITSPS
jgi:hypothetical protein